MAEQRSDHDTVVGLVPRFEAMKETVDRIEKKLDQCQGQRTNCFENMTHIRIESAKVAQRSGILWGLMSSAGLLILAALLKAFMAGAFPGVPQ